MAPCVWAQAGGGAAGSGGAAGQDAFSREDDGREKGALRGPGGTALFPPPGSGVSRKTHADPLRRWGCALLRRPCFLTLL